MQPIESTILRQLFADAEYAQRVVPYLKAEYFPSYEVQPVYRAYALFYEKFKKVPQFSIVGMTLEKLKDLSDKQVENAKAVLAELEQTEPLDNDQKDWLLENTEEFCQDRAMFLALQEAIKVMHDEKTPRHVIPDLMKNALGVSFDTNIGHSFYADADARFDFYHKAEERIPFDIDLFNQMTKGGLPRKTLNIIMAGTNVGKSLVMCHMAAANLRMNKNVLYITLEMAEERIAERIDANMMNIPLDDLEQLPRVDYIRKIQHLRQTSKGELVIKQFPASSAHAGHFTTLMQELERKKNFKPDIVYIDYLTICGSTRAKLGSGVNSYTLYKNVAEELRSLGVEFNIPVVTAAQFNRQGFGAGSDAALTDVGESWAIPQTADWMIALTQTEELEKVGQINIQPMKNRYQKRNSFAHELLGIDPTRMKIYDLNGSQKAAGLHAKAAGVATVAPATGGGAPPFKKPGNAFRRLQKPMGGLTGDDDDDK